jgi:hypothetical protein
MMSLHDRAAFEQALHRPLAPDLRDLLERHIKHAERAGLLDLTHILVIQPGDTEVAIVEEIGWSPLVSPRDGIRYGSAGFTPYWDWLQAHAGWFELTLCVGNTGFAYILLIDRAAGTLPDLLALCAAYASGPCG